MIVSLAGGEVLQGAVKGSEIKAEDVSVKISLERINQYLGTSLVVKEVNEILKHLDLAMKKGVCLFRSSTTKTLGYPNRSRYYRRSCSYLWIRPVAIYTSKWRNGCWKLVKEQETTRKIRTIFEGSGLSEAISYALTTEENQDSLL